MVARSKGEQASQLSVLQKLHLHTAARDRRVGNPLCGFDQDKALIMKAGFICGPGSSRKVAISSRMQGRMHSKGRVFGPGVITETRQTIRGDVSCATNKVSALPHNAQYPQKDEQESTLLHATHHFIRLVHIRHDGNPLFLPLSLSLSFAHALALSLSG